MSRDVQDIAGRRRISRPREGSVTVLQLTGELDRARAPQLSAALASACGGGARPVVLDMAGVGFLHSTSVRMLREAPHLAGRELVPMAPSRAFTRVLGLTR